MAEVRVYERERYPFGRLGIGDSFVAPFVRTSWDCMNDVVRKHNREGPGRFRLERDVKGFRVTRIS